MSALTAKLDLDTSGLKRGATESSKAIGDVSKDLKKLGSDLDTLEAQDVRIEVEAEVERAQSNLVELRRELIYTDGLEARAEVRADIDDAKADLDRVESELRALDGDNARIEVEADIEDAKRDLGEIEDLVGNLPGPAGQFAAAFNGPGGAVAGVAGLGAGLFTILDSQSKMAIEAKTFADLTGESLANSSRLITVASQAGIEFNDLADMALQLREGLADNAEYAKKLGINLADGKPPGERLVEVIDLMNSPLLDANEKAEIFAKLLGEEGVRQGQMLASTVGDISDAMERIPDDAVFTDEDVENAQRFQEVVQLIKVEVGAMATNLSRDFGAISEDLERLGELIGSATGDEGGVDWEQKARNVLKYSTGLGLLATQMDNVRKPVEMLGIVNDSLTGSFVSAGDALEANAASTGNYNSSAELRIYWDERGAEAAESMAAADEEAAEAAADRTAEIEALIDEMDRLAGISIDLVGGTLAVENAQLDAADAATEYHDALFGVDEEGQKVTVTAADLTRSFNDATEAQMKAAEAAAEYEIAQREEAGQTVTNIDKSRILAEEYRNIAGTLAEGSPLRQRLLGYANDLDAIPEEVTTVAEFDAPFDVVEAYIRMIGSVPNLKETTLRTIHENVYRDERFQENRFGQGGFRFADPDDLFARAGAQGSAASAQFGLNDAEARLASTLQRSSEVLNDVSSSSLDMQQAQDDAAEAAIDLARAQLRVAEAAAAQSGNTLDSVQALDIQNRKMLEAARTAEGPLRDAILSYVYQLNSVPDESVSDIRSQVDYGSLERATGLLDELSYPRSMFLSAIALTDKAEAKLKELTEPQSVDIYVNYVLPGEGPRASNSTAAPSAGGLTIGKANAAGGSSGTMLAAASTAPTLTLGRSNSVATSDIRDVTIVNPKASATVADLSMALRMARR